MPVEHVLLVSLAIHERQTKRTATKRGGRAGATCVDWYRPHRRRESSDRDGIAAWAERSAPPRINRPGGFHRGGSQLCVLLSLTPVVFDSLRHAGGMIAAGADVAAIIVFSEIDRAHALKPNRPIFSEHIEDDSVEFSFACVLGQVELSVQRDRHGSFARHALNALSVLPFDLDGYLRTREKSFEKMQVCVIAILGKCAARVG
jgi:hypothetical protein